MIEEIEPITEILISEAKKGNLKAIRELFDRAWGRPPQDTRSTINSSVIIGVDEVTKRSEGERLAKIAISEFLMSQNKSN